MPCGLNIKRPRNSLHFLTQAFTRQWTVNRIIRMIPIFMAREVDHVCSFGPPFLDKPHIAWDGLTAGVLNLMPGVSVKKGDVRVEKQRIVLILLKIIHRPPSIKVSCDLFTARLSQFHPRDLGPERGRAVKSKVVKRGLSTVHWILRLATKSSNDERLKGLGRPQEVEVPSVVPSNLHRFAPISRTPLLE